LRERPIAERSDRWRAAEPGACTGLAPFRRLDAATHLVLAETSPDLPRDARAAGRGLIAPVGQSQATQMRGGGVTLSIADIDSRLLVCAEAGSGGRELGARSSTTSALGWSRDQDRSAYRDLAVSRARLTVRLRPSRLR
jgi:hypothetical protein